jgi:hypothetical protein
LLSAQQYILFVSLFGGCENGAIIGGGGEAAAGGEVEGFGFGGFAAKEFFEDG